MTDKKESSFERLRKLDVSEHIEKKQGFSYLSWSWAWSTLCLEDPDADFEHHEPTTYQDGTMMVSCTVKAFGKSKKMHLPVIDYKNQAIKNPNSMQINTAMQRCLVKAIALHGLGLYIYSGEDLPPDQEPKPEVKTSPLVEQCRKIKSEIEACESEELLNQYMEEQKSVLEDIKSKNEKNYQSLIATRDAQLKKVGKND